MCLVTLVRLASYLGPAQLLSLAVRKSGREPDIFFTFSDVGIERMVERVLLCVAHWAQNSKRAKVPGNLPHVSS